MKSWAVNMPTSNIKNTTLINIGLSINLCKFKASNNPIAVNTVILDIINPS